jgi:K+-sensing histidine kinase KdpD
MKIIVRHNDRNEEVHIHDFGKGISVKDRVQLFDLVLTGKLLGTGLGLIIYRKIAKRQEGTIDLAGWTHLNMAFVIRFPRYPVDGQGGDHSCADWYDGLRLGERLVTVLRNAPEVPMQSHQGGKRIS